MNGITDLLGVPVGEDELVDLQVDEFAEHGLEVLGHQHRGRGLFDLILRSRTAQNGIECLYGNHDTAGRVGGSGRIDCFEGIGHAEQDVPLARRHDVPLAHEIEDFLLRLDVQRLATEDRHDEFVALELDACVIGLHLGEVLRVRIVIFLRERRRGNDLTQEILIRGVEVLLQIDAAILRISDEILDETDGQRGQDGAGWATDGSTESTDGLVLDQLFDLAVRELFDLLARLIDDPLVDESLGLLPELVE